MTAHTPELWDFRVGKLPRTVSFKRKYWEVGAHHGKGVAIVFGDTDEHARLIAAAPALLTSAKKQEAAEAFHLACVECEGNEIPELCEACFPHYDDARLARRTAIAKAEGRT